MFSNLSLLANGHDSIEQLSSRISNLIYMLFPDLFWSNRLELAILQEGPLQTIITAGCAQKTSIMNDQYMNVILVLTLVQKWLLL